MGKLQVRRGNKIDMPNPLDSGELGWTTDSKQLYMGTGVANSNVFIGGSPATDDYSIYLATSALGGRAVSAGASGLKIENGTTTSASASKLINANATFTSALVDKTVYNSTDGTWAKIDAVDSGTTLSLSADIMGTGEAYDICDAVDTISDAYSVVPSTYGVNISIVASAGTFTYAGAVTLGGKTASGNVALSLTGNSGGTTIESTTTTTLTFGDDITISTITFGDSVILNGDVTLTTCPITGSLTANGTLTTLTNSDIGGALTSIGSVILDSTNVTGAVDVGGDFTNTNGITVGGNFNVDGACSLDTAAITGNTTTNSSLTNTISLDVTGDLTTNGVADVVNVSVGDDLITNDNFTCATDLDVVGDLTANGVTTVEGTITVGGNFVLNGSWIQTDSLAVTGSFTAYGEVICSNVTVGANLETRENFTQTGTLAVTGTWNSYGISNCQGITITGQAEFFGKLYLTGAGNVFNGKVLYHERFEVLAATFNKSVYSLFGGDGVWTTCTITSPYKLYVYSGSANRMVSGTYTIGNDPQGITNIGATVTRGYTMYVASSTFGGSAGADGLAITSGTATGTTANKLVDSNASFTEAEHLGKTVYNSTDDTWAKVDAVDDENTLSLSADIMANTESYVICDAISTVQLAVDNIPGIFNCETTIKCSTETFTEAVTVKGKSPTGNYNININGSMTIAVASATNDISQATTILKRTTCGDAHASYTTNAYRGMQVELKDSGGNSKGIRTVYSNDGTTITIAGYWTSDATSSDTFIVYNYGSIIAQSAAHTFTMGSAQKSVVMNKMRINQTGSSYFNVNCLGNTAPTFNNCGIYGEGASVNLLTFDADYVLANYCFFRMTKNARYNMSSQSLSYIGIIGCYVEYETGTAGQNIIVTDLSVCIFQSRSMIKNITGKATQGIYVAKGSTLNIHGSATDYQRASIDNCTTGIYFLVNSFSNNAKLTTYITYANCTTANSLLANSNCYYDAS